MAHTFNRSYSGGINQEDCSLKLAWANNHETLSQKTFHKNRTGGVAQGVGPELKPQNLKKINKLTSMER
jgi:hypothetical protein